MDAFEQVVAEILWREGYWVRTSVKVELTKEEKRAIGLPSAPRWELDVVAFRAKDNSLKVVECKSYLDSPGVRLRGFDPSHADATRFKLFNSANLRDVVFSRLRQQFADAGACLPNATVQLCLACGRICTAADGLFSSEQKMNALKNANIEILTPAIGARIEGVDISATLDDSDIVEIRRLFLKRRVIFFENQDLSPQRHRDFAARFGAFELHPFYQAHPDCWELVVLDTGAHNPTDNDHWHTDMTYCTEPPMAGILYSRLIPPQGGDTLWADMHAAYLALSGSLRSLLDPLDAVHDLAKAFPPDHRAVGTSGSGHYAEKMKANPPVLHPVVRSHPETGEDCLFVNEGFTTAIQGLAKKESDDLLAFLFAHVHRPEFSVRWRWKPNTLAMWDNRSTQHYAVNDYLPHRRVMHRATLKGSRPFNRLRPTPCN